MRRIALVSLAVIFLVGSAFGVEVFVDPPQVHLQPGGNQIFTAAAADENGDTLDVSGWEWSVHPPRIGSITTDGVFTAADHPCRGIVSAACYVDSVRYVGAAHVFVEEARYRLIVRPREAFLVPGETVQYEAWLASNLGDSIGGLTLEWSVEPAWLGNITDEGLFVAGDMDGRGSVIATTIYTRRLSGAGFVAISRSGWGDITGIVTNEQGGSLDNASISVFIPPHRDPIRTAISGQDGTYLLASLYPGSYWVRAEAPHHLPEFYNNSPGIEGATPVEVEGGSITHGIDFSLDLAGIITGRVTASNDSLPLRHAHVTAFGVRPFPFQHCAPADAQGYYAIGDLLPGTYIVRADADGFAPEFWEEAPIPQEADSIVIGIGTVVNGIDFTLDPLWPQSDGHLSGVVTDDSTGAPIPGAHIMLFKIGPGFMRMFQQRTDDDGTFAFERLPYGDYIAFCGAQGYLHEYYDNVPFWRDATILRVNESSSPEIAIALTPRSGGGLCAFGGVIHDANGNPLEGVIIRAEGAITATAETDPDGQYYVEVPEGQYILSADRTSMTTRYYPNALEPSGAATLTVDSAIPEREADFTLDEALGTEQEDTPVPQSFGVTAIYPNPFNPTTRISYALPTAGKVKLAVYDILGREVAILVDGVQTAGTQSVTFNGSNLASGLYFVRLSGTWGVSTHKMLLLK
jgi:hypothetical protein